MERIVARLGHATSDYLQRFIPTWTRAIGVQSRPNPATKEAGQRRLYPTKVISTHFVAVDAGKDSGTGDRPKAILLGRNPWAASQQSIRGSASTLL